MQFYRNRCLAGGMGAVLALVLTASMADGGTMSPSDSNSLAGELSAFMGGFGQWNASLNNLPLEFWEMAPSADKAEAEVVLFWLWMLDGKSGSQGDSSGSANSPPPSGSGNSGDPPIGAIFAGKPDDDGSSSHSGKNDPSSLHSNDDDDPPGIRGIHGNNSLGSDPPSPNSGGHSPFGDPPLFAGSGDGRNPAGNPLSGGSSGGSGAKPFDGDPTPEPTAFTLLAVGGVGLLMGRWVRRRRSS